MERRRANLRVAGSEARPGPLRTVDGPSVPQNAGTLDLRASVGELDTFDLAYQAAWIIDVPWGIHRMAALRLAKVLAELTERARDVLGERER